jgi:TIR domain
MGLINCPRISTSIFTQEDKMPIFISYSHKDSKFVDMLAANLVKARHNVWMDRWELNIGDSITQKIEEKLTDSSAILVIISKNSVSSNWCKRELTAGLVRELEDRRTIVLPIIIDDCAIPLFLRDKLHADFRRNQDEAFNLVDKALSKISNATTGRTENPEFLVDYALDWKRKENADYPWIIRWTFVDHSPKYPYVVLSECQVYPNDCENLFYKVLDDGVHQFFIKRITEGLVAHIEKKPLQELISDQFEHYVAWKMQISKAVSRLKRIT